jgi:hypothetical protein
MLMSAYDLPMHPSMSGDQGGTSRGFDYVAFSLPVLCFGGLAVASIGLPAWSVGGALAAAVAGVVTAIGLANASRRLPSWVQTGGIAAAIFVSGLTASLSMRVMIVPLGFVAALVCAGLRVRRRQLPR